MDECDYQGTYKHQLRAEERTLTKRSQETLRYHPISPWVTRESAIHDIIPLAEPLVTKSGKTITEIPIGPGVPVLVSTCAYNR